MRKVPLIGAASIALLITAIAIGTSSQDVGPTPKSGSSVQRPPAPLRSPKGLPSTAIPQVIPAFVDSQAPPLDELGFESKPNPEALLASSPVSELIELSLDVIRISDQIESTNKALLSMSEGVWGQYWDAGQYEVRNEFGPGFLEDENGRPRPMQIRSVAGETRVVVLDEQLYPQIWNTLENLSNMRDEKLALERMLASLQKDLQSK